MHLVDHVQHLCCMVIRPVGASIFPVYGIVLYLEFTSNLEYLSAGREHRQEHRLVRDRPLLSRPDCRW